MTTTQMPTSLTLSENEAVVMLHRLQNLTDEGHCEEVFEDEPGIDCAQAAEFAQQVVDLINQKIYVLPIDHRVALEVLADSLEGSTFFGDADDAVEDGEISRQKLSAYKRAANSAAAKIEKLIGRPVNAVLD